MSSTAIEMPKFEDFVAALKPEIGQELAETLARKLAGQVLTGTYVASRFWAVLKETFSRQKVADLINSVSRLTETRDGNANQAFNKSMRRALEYDLRE